jgi:hypothetical protein
MFVSGFLWTPLFVSACAKKSGGESGRERAGKKSEWRAKKKKRKREGLEEEVRKVRGGEEEMESNEACLAQDDLSPFPFLPSGMLSGTRTRVFFAYLASGRSEKREARRRELEGLDAFHDKAPMSEWRRCLLSFFSLLSAGRCFQSLSLTLTLTSMGSRGDWAF